MNCDFCGERHAAPFSIPYFIYDDLTDEQMGDRAIAGSAWGHPLTGNACRTCLVDQMMKASKGKLVKSKSLTVRLLDRLYSVLMGMGFAYIFSSNFSAAIITAGVTSVVAFIEWTVMRSLRSIGDGSDE